MDRLVPLEKSYAIAGDPQGSGDSHGGKGIPCRWGSKLCRPTRNFGERFVGAEIIHEFVDDLGRDMNRAPTGLARNGTFGTCKSCWNREILTGGLGDVSIGITRMIKILQSTAI